MFQMAGYQRGGLVSVDVHVARFSVAAQCDVMCNVLKSGKDTLASGSVRDCSHVSNAPASKAASAHLALRSYSIFRFAQSYLI